MDYLDLMFDCQLEVPLQRIPFLGPTLRGMLGHGLRALACPHQPSGDGYCAEGERCVYSYLFEGPSGRGHGRAARRAIHLPQPFVLLVDPPSSRLVRHSVHFGVRLFGAAIDSADLFARAVESRGRHGLGAAHAPFRILGVSARRGVVPLLSAGGARSRNGRTRVVELLFRTPVFLHGTRRGHGRATPPSGNALVEAIRRRAELLRLAARVGSNLGRGSASGSEATGFRLVHHECRQWSIYRRSGRQNRVIQLHGLLGRVCVEGPWDAEPELLEVLSIIRLGKHTSFGLGDVVVNSPEVSGEGSHHRETSRRRNHRDIPRWIRLRGLPPVEVNTTEPRKLLERSG